MNGKELSISLREMARAQGLCDQWYGEWKDNTDVDALLDKFVRGQDFCILNDYPSLEFIRNNFRKEDLHRNHIYVDDDVKLKAESGTYIFLGDCTGSIDVGGFRVTTIYARHNSNLSVHGEGNAKVFISLYEHGNVSPLAYDDAKVRVYDRRKKEGA